MSGIISHWPLSLVGWRKRPLGGESVVWWQASSVSSVGSENISYSCSRCSPEGKDQRRCERIDPRYDPAKQTVTFPPCDYCAKSSPSVGRCKPASKALSGQKERTDVTIETDGSLCFQLPNPITGPSSVLVNPLENHGAAISSIHIGITNVAGAHQGPRYVFTHPAFKCTTSSSDPAAEFDSFIPVSAIASTKLSYKIPFCTRHSGSPEHCQGAGFLLNPRATPVITSTTDRGDHHRSGTVIEPATPTPFAPSKRSRQVSKTPKATVPPPNPSKTKLHLLRKSAEDQSEGQGDGKSILFTGLDESQTEMLYDIADEINRAEDLGFNVGYEEGYRQASEVYRRLQNERKREFRLAIEEIEKLKKDKQELEMELDKSKQRLKSAEKARDEVVHGRLWRDVDVEMSDDMSIEGDQDDG